MNMQSEIMENGIRHIRHGDYFLPKIIDASQVDSRPIGKWGLMHEAYLKENRPGLYTRLLLNGTLHTMLAEVDEAADRRFKLVIRQMQEHEGVTEALKSADQMEWVRRMGSIISRAEETVLTELILC